MRTGTAAGQCLAVTVLLSLGASAQQAELEALRQLMGEPRVHITHEVKDKQTDGKPPFRHETWCFTAGLRQPEVKYSRYLNVPPHFGGSHPSLINTDMGIGLDGGYGNWYRGGFIRVLVNGRDVLATRCADTVRAEDGAYGRLRFLWSLEQGGRLALTLAVPTDGAAVYSAIEVSGVPVETLRVRLSCYPGGFGPAYGYPSHRWAATSNAEAEVPENFVRSDDTPFPVLPLRRGVPWVFYADRRQHKGSLGVFMLPEEGAEGEVKMSNYGQTTVLDYPAGSASAHLAFYAFAIENAPAKELFLRSAPAEAERLRALPFWPQ